MKKLRSIVMGMFLILAAAVPVFAVDGVETVVPGSEAYSTSWGNNAIYDHVAVLDLNTSDGLSLYDIEKNTYKVLGAYGAQKYQKSIYKNRLVYYSGNFSGIKLMDTDTLATRQISATGTHPSIYGDKIAYIKDYNVYLYDLDNDTEVPLTTNGRVYKDGGDGMGRGTDIYGDNVIWVEFTPEGVYSMVIYNIWTKQSRTLNIASDDLGSGGRSFKHFDLYENYVAWNYTTRDYSYNAYLYDLNTDTYFVLATNNDWFININNGKVIWDTGGPIGIYDLKTKVLSHINTSSRGPWNPVTDGDKVLYPVWGLGYYMFDITSPGEEIYSLNSTGNSVTVINPYKTDDTSTPDDERKVATITTGTGSSDAGLSPDETKLYVLNTGSKNVNVVQTYGPTGDFQVIDTKNVNPTSNQIITSVAGDNDSNVYVALKPKSGTGAGLVRKLSASGATDLTVGVNPNSLKISPDNKTLFVSNGDSGNVTSIDLATFVINSSIATGAGPKLVKP